MNPATISVLSMGFSESDERRPIAAAQYRLESNRKSPEENL
jgi:hypothetical protein